MRHAESSNDYRDLADHDRPLNARGQSDARRVADVLTERGWLPQLVLVSSSTRTLETLEGMAPRIGGAKTDIRPEIYHAGISTLLIQLEDMLGEGTTMILGHNPGSEVLINHLTGEWREMPPAAAALLAESGGGWSIEGIIRPRELD
jgi:phosphohistidine phosphatase